MMKHLLPPSPSSAPPSAPSARAQTVAQEWPTRAVKLYVLFGPSTPDMVARVADRRWRKQPFVVEDKPVQAGAISAATRLKAERQRARHRHRGAARHQRAAVRANCL
jgi:hypothetical protein